MTFQEFYALWLSLYGNCTLVLISNDGRYLVDAIAGVMDMYSRRAPNWHYQLTNGPEYDELTRQNPVGMVVYRVDR